MSGTNYIRSIKDLEMATYGLQGRAGNDLLKVDGVFRQHDLVVAVMSV